MNQRSAKNRHMPLKPLILLFFLLAFSGSLFSQTQDLLLEEALRVLGAELRWDPLSRGGVLSVQGHYAAFLAGSFAAGAGGAGEQGPVLLDNREVYTMTVPYLSGGSLYFPAAFMDAITNALNLSIYDDSSRFRIAAIIVDPGHGGKDTGAVGNHLINGLPLQLLEKDLNLRVSGDLHALLSAAYPDKRVLLTRTGDTYPTLEDRVVIANSVPLKDNEAIVFISIHANASFNKAGRGYEVWYLSPDYRRTVIDETKFSDSAEVLPILNAMMEEEFTTESIMMAQFIMKAFQENLGAYIPPRGIKAEEWFVVRNARMPSVLVEMGFVTNEEDALLMTDESYLQKLSQALYKGIADFVAMFERSGGFTTIDARGF
jgi:N-acetylmuramoyl-L-alanine amidase